MSAAIAALDASTQRAADLHADPTRFMTVPENLRAPPHEHPTQRLLGKRIIVLPRWFPDQVAWRQQVRIDHCLRPLLRRLLPRRRV
jgi:hypothetical protein